jgi:hypothetical protein
MQTNTTRISLQETALTSPHIQLMYIYWRYIVRDRYNFKGNIFSTQDSGHSFPLSLESVCSSGKNTKLRSQDYDVGSVLRIMKIDR